MGHTCYHCKQWVEENEPHDCWTTTERALTEALPEDLRDAWERLRQTAAEFGDQRIYASHHSIMFSRKSCYFFVRPKKNFLEVCVFLGRTLTHPFVQRVDRASKAKAVHFFRLVHRDQVETPFTDWLREAYDLQDPPAVQVRAARSASKEARAARRSTAKTKKVASAARATRRASSAKRGRASKPPRTRRGAVARKRR